jgi:hypothetical protein
MISFELVGSDDGHTQPCAASGSGSWGDQQRRMGRRLPGRSPAQKSGAPTKGAAAVAAHGASNGRAAIGALQAGGAVLLTALNTSSRHGPQSAVPAAAIATSESHAGCAIHAQKPDSSLSSPSAETQIEPLAIVGRTRRSWRSASNRVGHFGARMGV